MNYHHYTDFEEFLQVYDPLADEVPIFITLTGGYIVRARDRLTDPGIYVVTSFRHGEDVYVCYEKALTLQEQFTLPEKRELQMRRRSYWVKQGAVTGAWPVYEPDEPEEVAAEAAPQS